MPQLILTLFKRSTTPGLFSIFLLLSLQPDMSWAQAANDVDCLKC
jgi:hypothetical protein